jgi:hypothetical protein
MKKIVLFMVSILAFASCSKNNFDTITPQEVKEQQYAAAFEQTFGAPASNQTWGFTTPAKTRAADVNGNLWYQKWKRPTNVTQEEIDWAKEEFGKVRENVQPWVSIEWSNYWVQQVYQGQRGSIDGNGNTVYPSGVMNRLMVFNNKKTNVISWYPYEEEVVTYEGEYEHVNNFNSANNATEYTDDVTEEKFKGTTLMINMGTDGRAEQFAYHNTSSSDYYYSYIVLEHNGSYFVGFDFYAVHPDGQEANKNMDVERDWKFNDWIIKITPAKSIYKFPSDPVRVMAEDLGTSSSDFDYNDVVFDVLFVNDNGDYKANITLQAAGGTLPLYFKYGSNDAFEVHKKFEVATDVMVNTHAADRGLKGVDNKQPVSNIWLDIEDKSYESAEDAVDALKIVVISGGNTIYLTPKASYENYSNAPKMIVAPRGTEWVDERVLISKVYSKFVDWISDSTVEWWVK